MATRQSVQTLKFSQSLRSSTNSELAKRLKALHTELRDYDQDLIDPTSLDKVARELIHTSLLLHKDKAVKAFAGCCLVDILRLYAPEAPYTQAELRDLFSFLVDQFKKVGEVGDPHQSEYFFIVDSLASVKSIVLVCDLESGSEELVQAIFATAIDSIKPTSPKNVEIALSDILLSIIEELPSLPPTVTHSLVSQFFPQNIKNRPASFRLAAEVCKGASDKLQRYVSQYFAEVIQDTIEGKGHGEDSDESDDSLDSDDEPRRRKSTKGKGAVTAKGKGKGKGKAKDGNKGGGANDDLPFELVEAHDLVRSLNRHAPSLLLNVIPLLSSELTSTASPKYRRLATTCLGAMFAEKQGAGDLAGSFPTVWKEWTKRAGDVTAMVRSAVAGCLRRIWTEHAELSPDIEEVLKKLLSDPDEKVRLAACHIFEEIDYETACHHVSRRSLEVLGERTVDRKEKVRQIAYRSLARLFDLAYSEIETRDEHAVRHFGWIPGKLLDGLIYSDGSQTAASPSQLHLVESTFSEQIIPKPSSEATLSDDIPSWVDRFLNVEQLLDPSTNTQRQALFSVTRLHEARGGSVWEAYITACEANNSGIIDDKDKASGIKEFLAKTIKAIAIKLPDPTKAVEDLKTFAKENSGQLYRELKVLLDPQTDMKLFLKNEKDFMRRIGKLNDSTVSTFSAFIRLSCYTMLNRSSIPHLLKRLVPSSTSTESEGIAASAHRTLTYIAKTRPIIFKSHVAELTKLVNAMEKKGSENESESAIANAAIGTALKALARLKVVDEGFVIDAKLSKRAATLTKEATIAEHAKSAATLVALDRTRSGACDDLVEHLADALSDDSPEDLVPHLAALAAIAKHGQDSFEQKSEAITVQCLEILKRSTRASESSSDPEASWIDDADLPPLTAARLLALKVLVNRCLPFAGTESSTTVATPVFGFLWKLVGIGREGGEEEERLSPVVASRLRLKASTSVLKLLGTKDPALVKLAIKNFALLSRTAQDTCFEVRDGYLRKLLHYLRLNRLHPATLPFFHMSLFLIAHEPDEDLKTQIIQFIKTRSRRQDRQVNWELPFLRLISILAHHPDFEGAHSIDEYRLMSKYFELYLECLATNENISLLYHLAQLVKGARDAASSSFDTSLYTLSELAQHLVKSFAERHTWPLTTLPKSTVAVKLPGDAFRAISDPAKAKEITKTAFVSEDVLKELGVKEKKITVPRKRKTADGSTEKKKRVVSSSKRKSKRPAKKRKSGQNDWDSDQSSEQEASSEEEDEEDEEEEGVKSGSESSKKVSSAKKSTSKSRSKKKEDSMEVDEDEVVEKKKGSPAKGKGGKQNGKAKKGQVKPSPQSAERSRRRGPQRNLKAPRKINRQTDDLDEVSDVGNSSDEDEKKSGSE